MVHIIGLMIVIILIGLGLYMIERRSFLGGLLFATLTIVLSIILFFQTLFHISEKGEVQAIIVLLLFYGVLPIIFICFVVWLIYNSRIMQTKEGKSTTAKLALALGLNLIIVFPLFFFTLSGAFQLPNFWMTLIIFGSLLDILFVFIFIAYLLYSLFYQLVPIKKTIDYIIILGAGIKSDTVTPLLKSRLDKAIEYQKRQEKPLTFVVSGGQGPDEPVSEAFAMRKYLLSQHIPEEQILFEDQSTSTYENMIFSKKLIEEDWQDKDKKPNILFSTSNYHVMRGAFYARRAKLKAEGIGAPVALYFLPTALIREYIALLVEYKWFTGLVVAFVFALLVVTSL